MSISRFAPLLALALAPFAAAGDQDFYVSAPLGGGIWKGDPKTGTSTPHALGLLIPHYGWFAQDGTFYVPDRGWPALIKIAPNGQVSALSAGGFFVKPVTCIPSLDGNALVVSEGEADMILRVDLATGAQSVMFDNTTAGGLLDSPDGLAYDDAGNLYVANLAGHTIVKIDPQGNASVFADQTMINQPGGLAIDGAGNLFVANYAASNIVRFRLDTGIGEVFAANHSIMPNPNDLKLSRSGGILTSTRASNVCRVDALGNIVVEWSDPTLGELVGVAVPEDATLCTGRFTTYGEGKAGTGGIVPQLRAIFSPCAGQTVAIEIRDFVGGAPALVVLGTQTLAQGAVKVAGASLLVDPAGALFTTIPLVLPGTGAGNGDLTLQFVVPDLPGIAGAEFAYQVLAGDAGATFGVSASNGLHEVIGL
jgi:sugar lactone lactonase YvrE